MKCGKGLADVFKECPLASFLNVPNIGVRPEREPQPEAAVSLRNMVTLVTWTIFRTEFLVYKMFCNDILFELVLMHLRDYRGKAKMDRVKVKKISKNCQNFEWDCTESKEKIYNPHS